MAAGIEAPDEDEAPDVTVKLRPSDSAQNRTVFEELCEERGLDTTAAVARYIGLSPRQIRRILDQDDDPSGTFIGKALTRWPRCSFRALFMVVDRKTGKERR